MAFPISFTTEQDDHTSSAKKSLFKVTTLICMEFASFFPLFLDQADDSAVIQLMEAVYHQFLENNACNAPCWTGDEPSDSGLLDYRDGHFHLNLWTHLLLLMKCSFSPPLTCSSFAFARPAVVTHFQKTDILSCYGAVFKYLAFFSIRLLACDAFFASLDRARFSDNQRIAISRRVYSFHLPSEETLALMAIQHALLFLPSEWVLSRLVRVFHFGVPLDRNDDNMTSGLENMRVCLVQVLWNVLCSRYVEGLRYEVSVGDGCDGKGFLKQRMIDTGCAKKEWELPALREAMRCDMDDDELRSAANEVEVTVRDDG